MIDVADGTPDDTHTEAGIVGYDGVLGVFDINLTALGIVSGSTAYPEMSFSSLVISSGAGTLDIWLSDIGFGPTSGFFETTVSGTTGGSVQFDAFSGTILFDESNAIGSIGSISGSDASGSFTGLNDYSLTFKTSVTHTGSASTSITSLRVQVVPEPASTALFIAGGVTIGLRTFRKKKSSAG